MGVFHFFKIAQMVPNRATDDVSFVLQLTVGYKDN